jgi:hypothetical protein
MLLILVVVALLVPLNAGTAVAETGCQLMERSCSEGNRGVCDIGAKFGCNIDIVEFSDAEAGTVYSGSDWGDWNEPDMTVRPA